jgi:hypothetical protein
MVLGGVGDLLFTFVEQTFACWDIAVSKNKCQGSGRGFSQKESDL